LDLVLGLKFMSGFLNLGG